MAEQRTEVEPLRGRDGKPLADFYQHAGYLYAKLKAAEAELDRVRGPVLTPSHVAALDIALDAGVKALAEHGNGTFWGQLNEARAVLRLIAERGEHGAD